MRYFMITDDGSKFGPADLRILNQWVIEGRVLPSSTLQEVATARYVRAETVPGLQFPAAMQPYMTPPMHGTPPSATPSASPRPGAYVPSRIAAHEADRLIVACWTLGSLGILAAPCPFTFPLPLIGLFLSLSARAKGHPSAKSALILNIAGLVISLGIGLLILLP